MPTPTSHDLLPLGHEAIAKIFPISSGVALLTAGLRSMAGYSNGDTVSSTRFRERVPEAEWFLGELERVLIAGGEEHRLARDKTLACEAHLHCALNFSLHRRKVFWVDGSLAWMLLHTNLDVEGRTLRLPFPCFALAFQDDATLEIVDALLAHDSYAAAYFKGNRSRILTAYVILGASDDSGTDVDITFVADAAAPGTYPYLFVRHLHIRPDDDLATVLQSQNPGPAAAPDMNIIVGGPELEQLVHLVVNAILYATSAAEAWPLLPSPSRAVENSVARFGKKRQQRAATRAAAMRRAHSNESVFFLPGKIPLSQLRRMRDTERRPAGAQLFSRFMVRGHWRRPAGTWSDQRLRWIEPYWKGPEMAAIVEREYRMHV